MSADESEATPPRPAELSKVPSWILLGFVLGALFVLLFRLKGPQPPPVIQPGAAHTELIAPQESPTPPAKAKSDPTLNTIEAVWAFYGSHAVWDGDLTEVAIWNSETKSFRDCFEVRRYGDQVYFRTIPRLTRPAVDRGLGTTAPILLTAPAPSGKSP